MSRVIVIAARASRSTRELGLLRSTIVCSCALALILAKAPFGI